MTRYMRWLAAERGLELRRLRVAVALVGHRDRGLLGVDLGLLRGRGIGAVLRGPPRPRDAGRRLVRRRPPELSPQHIFRDRDDADVAVRHASELRDLGELTLGRAPGPGRPRPPPACASWASSAATGSSPTCRTSRRRSSPSSPPPASARSGRAARPTSAPRASSTASRRSSPRSSSASTATATAAATSTAPTSSPGSSRAMPTLERTVVLPYLASEPDLSTLARAITWDDLLASGEGATLEFEQVPFDHPLWVLYSSGTTGLPKAIVQGHGGILLEQLKKLNLHVDAQEGDRLFWFTTTGWMMWNFLVGGLLTPASIVLYDGSPGHPDMGVLWDLAERAGMTCFGTSASYIAACMKAGVEPSDGRDLSAAFAPSAPPARRSRPRASSGSIEHVGRDTWLFSTSGGTDVCTAFVGGVPLLPVLPRRAPGPGARRQGRGVRRGRQLDRRRGRRAGDHRADALDAPLPVGRRRRLALPRQLLRASTPASGATATGSRSPRAEPPSSTAAPTPRSTARASAWGPARSTAPSRASRRSPTRSWSTSPSPGPRAGWPCSWSSPTARRSTTSSPARSSAASASSAPPGTSRTTSYEIAEVPRTLSRQGARGSCQAHPHGHPARPGGEPRLARQPALARLLRRAGGHPGRRNSRGRA